jgi:hypothetical protein
MGKDDSLTNSQITNVCSGILTTATFQILMVAGISFNQQELGWLKSTETVVSSTVLSKKMGGLNGE